MRGSIRGIAVSSTVGRRARAGSSGSCPRRRASPARLVFANPRWCAARIRPATGRAWRHLSDAPMARRPQYLQGLGLVRDRSGASSRWRSEGSLSSARPAGMPVAITPATDRFWQRPTGNGQRRAGGAPRVVVRRPRCRRGIAGALERSIAPIRDAFHTVHFGKRRRPSESRRCAIVLPTSSSTPLRASPLSSRHDRRDARAFCTPRSHLFGPSRHRGGPSDLCWFSPRLATVVARVDRFFARPGATSRRRIVIPTPTPSRGTGISTRRPAEVPSTDLL